MATFDRETMGDGVVVVGMDDPGASVNTLKEEMLGEFDALLSSIEGDARVRIVVFRSNKADSFIAGANLDMIVGISGAERGSALSRKAQALSDRIENLAPVTVAAIHGPCLGGGLELALAFDARVASDAPVTRLGLPEVRLGLIPGGGGTQRLPATVGCRRALDLMLTGRSLTPRQARRVGLLDETVPKEVLMQAAVERARAIERAGQRRARRRSPAAVIEAWLLCRNPIGRALLFGVAERGALRKTRGNYPAAIEILRVVRTGLERGRARGLAAEAQAFGKLAVGPESVALVGLFRAVNDAKKDPGTTDPAIGPVTVDKVGILGAGLMGAAIAGVTVHRAGVTVRLKDRDHAGVARGLRHVDAVLSARRDKGAMGRLERERALARLSGTIDYSGFGNCQVVIEAVDEDLGLKRQMVREVQGVCGEGAIFASNTSAIPIADIAAEADFPERVIGMHYFSPVEKMPLLEIVRAEKTAPSAVATCVALGKRQGKTVIVVGDGPGFYTTRILGAYMVEAARLLTEGVAADRIDEALLDFGFAMGPMAVLDEVGIDVAHEVASTLNAAFGDRMALPAGLRALVDDGRKGRKNGRGIYRYGRGARLRKAPVDGSIYRLLGVTPDDKTPPAVIAERCALQMVNEAARCLGEGILGSARDGDIGAVLGLGFPPFLGGPFAYADRMGGPALRARLESLAKSCGARFAPAPLIVRAEKFYNREQP